MANWADRLVKLAQSLAPDGTVPGSKIALGSLPQYGGNGDGDEGPIGPPGQPGAAGAAGASGENTAASLVYAQQNFI